jgi:hypothetical protein
MNKVLNVSKEGQPWWRFGLVWMVIGGPAVVVVAGFITFYIAATNPDPVLNVTPRTAMQERQGITHVPAMQERQGITHVPAMQGRNHAATGELPAALQTPAAEPTKP